MLTNVTLAVERGPQTGAACHLDAPATCVIGSASDSDFPVIGAEQPADVSRHQCRVEVAPTGARLCDLCSQGGTLLNGHPVDCWPEDDPAHDLRNGRGVELADGDRITFGGIVLRVELTTDQTVPAQPAKNNATNRRAVSGVLSC